MIKDMKGEVEKMAAQHPDEWKRAHTGQPGSEDFIRILGKHLFTLDARMGLNGKRGDPKVLSQDVISVKGEGNSPDAVTGGICSLFDCIEGAGGSNPKPVWNFIQDPGPGTWVDPNTGTAPPVVVPPTQFILSRAEFMDEGYFLHRYYTAPEGLQRPEGLWKPTAEFPNGAPDFEGIAAWLFDIYQMARMKGKTREESRALYVAQIETSGEWISKHPKK